MQRLIRLAICRYYPSLYDWLISYDFAVIVANHDKIAVAVINLSYFGIEAKDYITSWVIKNTSDSVCLKVNNILGLGTYDNAIAAFDELTCESRTNIQYAHVWETESDRDPADIAKEVLLDCLNETRHRAVPCNTPDVRIATWSLPRASSVEGDLETIGTCE